MRLPAVYSLRVYAYYVLKVRPLAELLEEKRRKAAAAAAGGGQEQRGGHDAAAAQAGRPPPQFLHTEQDALFD